MSKSGVRILMGVLCLIALGMLIAGCEGQAAKEKAAPAAKAAKAEQPKPAAAKPAAEQPKPVAEKPKPAVAGKGPTLGPYNLANNWMDEQGFVNNWLLIGPFPNPGERPDNAGFNTDYLKTEVAYEPSSGMEVKDPNGNILKWQQYKSTNPEINFFSVESLKLEPSQEDILVYCACWLESDADKDVEIRIGSDDGYKLWLNHKLVSEQNVYRAMEMDQETHKVKLNKGMNLVILKVTQDWGEFSFEMRVVGSDGKAVPGVKVWN